MQCIEEVIQYWKAFHIDSNVQLTHKKQILQFVTVFFFMSKPVTVFV